MGTIRQKVALHGVRFYSYHGYYPEEQILGCEFLVDIETELEIFTDSQDNLGNTVNYEKLFEIARTEMNVPSKLIETVAHRILERIRHDFLIVKNIKVAIRKSHPPLAGQVQNSFVELIFNR